MCLHLCVHVSACNDLSMCTYMFNVELGDCMHAYMHVHMWIELLLLLLSLIIGTYTHSVQETHFADANTS